MAQRGLVTLAEQGHMSILKLRSEGRRTNAPMDKVQRSTVRYVAYGNTLRYYCPRFWALGLSTAEGQFAVRRKRD